MTCMSLMFDVPSPRSLAQRAFAAFRALSDRSAAVIFAARALPPLSPPRRPSSTASGSFLGLSMRDRSGIDQVEEALYVLLHQVSNFHTAMRERSGSRRGTFGVYVPRDESACARSRGRGARLRACGNRARH